MSKRPKDTRDRILQTAYEMFYRKGFARVGVDMIAESAGLTKRTLYYHFRSKDELLAAVLDRQGVLALERIRRWASGLTGDVDHLIDGFFAELATWASTPRWAGAGFTRLAMELADLPGHPARAAARRHKEILEAEFADMLAGAGVEEPRDRAREVFLLIEGAMALILIHGDRSYAEAAARAAKRLARKK